jgi:hypothetical protein
LTWPIASEHLSSCSVSKLRYLIGNWQNSTAEYSLPCFNWHYMGQVVVSLSKHWQRLCVATFFLGEMIIFGFWHVPMFTVSVKIFPMK